MFKWCLDYAGLSSGCGWCKINPSLTKKMWINAVHDLSWRILFNDLKYESAILYTAKAYRSIARRWSKRPLINMNRNPNGKYGTVSVRLLFLNVRLLYLRISCWWKTVVVAVSDFCSLTGSFSALRRKQTASLTSVAFQFYSLRSTNPQHVTNGYDALWTTSFISCFQCTNTCVTSCNGIMTSSWCFLKPSAQGFF